MCRLAGWCDRREEPWPAIVLSPGRRRSAAVMVSPSAIAMARSNVDLPKAGVGWVRTQNTTRVTGYGGIDSTEGRANCTCRAESR